MGSHSFELVLEEVYRELMHIYTRKKVGPTGNNQIILRVASRASISLKRLSSPSHYYHSHSLGLLSTLIVLNTTESYKIEENVLRIKRFKP